MGDDASVDLRRPRGVVDSASVGAAAASNLRTLLPEESIRTFWLSFNESGSRRSEQTKGWGLLPNPRLLEL